MGGKRQESAEMVWRGRLARFAKSGLTVTAFCLEWHVSEANYYRWRDRLKMLWWDRDGMAFFYKRLEAGTYQLPTSPEGQAGIEIDGTDLALILNGIDIRSAKRRKRYARVA